MRPSDRRSAKGDDELILESLVLLIEVGIMLRRAKNRSQRVARLSVLVLFTGAVLHASVPNYINACDFLIAPVAPRRPSVVEVSPLKVFEYLACGKPILASRLPGLEFIEEEGVGLLFSPEDENDLARAMGQITAIAKNDIARMEKKARQLAIERFGWDKIVPQILNYALDDT